MQTTAITNPLGLDITTADPRHFTTRQDYIDDIHVTEIADSMRAHGWRGAPLVAFTDGSGISWSGTHRLAAARATEIDVPIVDAVELFAACGIDLYALCADEDYDTDHEVPAILAHLPGDVLTAYALDDIC